jgi:DNA polymerase-3 subunit alpha
VKFDILGLKPLTAIKKTIDQLKSRGIHLNPDTIPLDDEATFELFRKGDCKYVFNFESMGMQEILRQVQPDRIEDLIALNALFRPGPMDKIPLLIELKHGHRPITYPHPGLEPFLKETYGMVVYQEQVMRIIQAVAGFSLGKADVFRRAMGKRKQEEIERLKADFVTGAQMRGVHKKEADEIFFLLSDNAGIVFNKSHAVAYSIIGFKCAYLKTHYRDAFIQANGE